MRLASHLDLSFRSPMVEPGHPVDNPEPPEPRPPLPIWDAPLPAAPTHAGKHLSARPGGGLAGEAYKRRRDRMGMALALAGAIDALLGLIETRRMTQELVAALAALDAGRSVEFGALIVENAPFQAITLSYAGQLGDLPFRVARFLTFNQGLQHDLVRLDRSRDRPEVQAVLIRQMRPLWETTEALGTQRVTDLRHAAEGRRPGRRR